MSERQLTSLQRIERDVSAVQVSTLVRLIVALNGVLFVVTALALLFAPMWFLENIGKYPPFNRHYMGDLGAFLLPIGIGLVFASRVPHQHRGVVGVAAGGSLLHALNHIYDSIVGSFPPARWLTETAPILILALLLLAAYWNITRR